MADYIIKLKDNDEYVIKMSKEDADNGASLYECRMISRDDSPVGFMNFNKKKDRIWLYIIEIYDDYKGKGLGTKFLHLLEHIAQNTRCTTIEGKYFPSVDYGVHFYNKNGYSIEKDGYNTEIYKYLGRNAQSIYENEFEMTTLENSDEISL